MNVSKFLNTVYLVTSVLALVVYLIVKRMKVVDD